MKNKLNWRQRLSLASGLAIVAAGNAAAALPAGLADSLDAAEADAIAAIALGGAMLLVIAIAGLAWRVASKYIKRAGGSA